MNQAPRSQALHQLSDFDRAKQCLVKVQKIEPHNEEITRELRKLDVSVKKFRELEKDLYGRMFAKKNNKVATAGNGDAPKVTLKECSQEFQKQVTETLSNFKDMDIQEMPLSVVSFTPSEIDYVTKCAAGMDFDIKYTGPKSERFMKIIKRSEAE
uniref:Uncharacterized protein LOC102801831 n=1 Tax=Saccoglossus kowalevskii TaxID=10224 RepID=A0ABM0MGC7_SACKO|nr:PREDICTED: uncharacterized protein LOC102801831 [Saccoglossus kowalevskii]